MHAEDYVGILSRDTDSDFTICKPEISALLDHQFLSVLVQGVIPIPFARVALHAIPVCGIPKDRPWVAWAKLPHPGR